MIQDDYESPTFRQGMAPSVISNSAPTTQQDKAELLGDWADNPLRTRAQAQAWFESRRTGSYAVNVRTRRSLDTANPSTATSRGRAFERHIPDGDGGDMGQLEANVQQSGSWSSHARHSRLLPEPFDSREDSGTTDPRRYVLQASKASSLAQVNKKVYF